MAMRPRPSKTILSIGTRPPPLYRSFFGGSLVAHGGCCCCCLGVWCRLIVDSNVLMVELDNEMLAVHKFIRYAASAAHVIGGQWEPLSLVGLVLVVLVWAVTTIARNSPSWSSWCPRRWITFAWCGCWATKWYTRCSDCVVLVGGFPGWGWWDLPFSSLSLSVLVSLSRSCIFE